MDHKLKEWAERLSDIRADIQGIIWRVRIYSELREIVAQNEGLHRPSHFWHFLKVLYADSVTMALRRHFKVRDYVSLAGLLDDMCKHWEELSIETLMENVTRSELDKEFQLRAEHRREIERVFETDKDGRIKAENIAGDLDDLQRRGKLIESHGDKRVAHVDPNRHIYRLPCYNNVEDCVRYMEKLVLKYQLLLQGVLGVSLDTPLDPGWKDIFRIPWIRSQP